MTEPLREWQDNAFNVYSKCAENKCNCLINAAVGAGKTKLAIVCAGNFLDARRDGEPRRQIIIVTNSRNLIRSWLKESRTYGLKLEAISDNSQLEKGISDSSDGYVMTYAALGSWPELHASYVAKRPTFVIVDEIHHLEEGEDPTKDSKWCEAAKTAFGHARFRLSLSGTPFRSNGGKIPFVTYRDVENEPGVYELVPDYSYGYGLAVAEGVCREVVFKPYPGQVRYTDGTGAEFETTFEEDLNVYHTGARLRRALEPDTRNHLLINCLTDANETLMKLRDGEHENAGGIIIAMDQAHARRVKKFLEEVTGESAEIILSDEADAVQKLERFRASSKPWVVAVNMISEGTDIPRLRIMVFATNKAESVLFFTQAMGRIVRTSDGPTGPSYFFMPADKRLLDYADKITEEIKLARTDKKTRTGVERERQENQQAGEFRGAEGEQGDNIVGGDIYEHRVLDNAEELRAKYPEFAAMSVARLTQLFKDIAKKNEEPVKEGEIPEEDWDQKLTRLRDDVTRRVVKYAKQNKREVPHVFTDLFNHFGIPNLRTASESQLELMRDYMEAKLDGTE